MSKKELDQLYLTKNERLGVLILFLLLLVLIIIPWLYTNSELIIDKSETKMPMYNNQPEMDLQKGNNTQNEKSEERNMLHNPMESKSIIELFEFDPNHLEAVDAKRLGIHDKSYRALQNYLATGAKINNSKQFSKIYGIDEKTFNTIEPYIRIKDAEKPYKLKEEAKSKSPNIINLNAASPEELVPLPGIGEKLASRIIKYRNLLGGFTDQSQLAEIYGLQDSTIQKFLPKISINGSVNKIKLNVFDYEALKSHPYIGAAKARVICEYRKQHPLFMGIADLYKLEALDSNWIERISKYLSFDQ